MFALPLLLMDALQQAAARLSMRVAELTPDQQAVLAFSDFVVDSLNQYPDWWQALQQQPPHPDEWQQYASWLQECLQPVQDETMLMQVLRQFRRQMLVRIAWLQTLHHATTEQSLCQLSWLAEVLIIAARDYLWKACCTEMGTPCNAQGVPQPLLILAMGKLGGGELNFSSDIDLIFCWPENGTTQGGRRVLDNSQFFTRLGQRLIKVLDHPTQQGFVYRVDMRLRPFGDSGPLVMSFAALEEYYQQQGRDWERYAMVKARVLGDSQDRWSQELKTMLRPFVFRRYIDFSVIQSLRTMKNRLTAEVRRRGLWDNIKLGAGGIREAEFIVQVFQLIRGGRERSLQQQAFLPSLAVIGQLALLAPEQQDALYQGYHFLRRLENLLQSIHDQQTQTLPEGPLDQARLAWAMECTDWSDLRNRLAHHMGQVRQIFNDLIGDDQPDNGEHTRLSLTAYHTVWQETLDSSELGMLLPHLATAEGKLLLQELANLQTEAAKRAIGPRGRLALDNLMPILLYEICQQPETASILRRLMPLLVAVLTRSTYLELLAEYHGALRQLIRLCTAAPMIARQLARYPILLDELLDSATLYQPTAQEAYRDELHRYLLRIPPEDDEQQLEALRQFKQAKLLHIAAADIAGTLPVMKVSDHLTWLAEAIIAAVVQQAWHTLVQRYGKPSHLISPTHQGFAVVGYGKLGGWELGYSSDLDLVFLHDCPPDVVTDGERSIDGRQFYLRLAQRVMHLFSTRTASGVLYEVDARLRPSGSAGLLVSTLTAFASYQCEEAWTWEHQALVRARIVWGEGELVDQFMAIRHTILCSPRVPDQLQSEVRDMREKMHQHHPQQSVDSWDIKTDQGGITDIEFIAQYLVLRYAASCPQLTRWSDNVRIFELMAHYHYMSAEEAAALITAYVTLRDSLHHLALQDLPGQVAADAFVVERAQVQQSWQAWLAG